MRRLFEPNEATIALSIVVQASALQRDEAAMHKI